MIWRIVRDWRVRGGEVAIEVGVLKVDSGLIDGN
jgi:hypothetical protein